MGLGPIAISLENVGGRGKRSEIIRLLYMAVSDSIRSKLNSHKICHADIIRETLFCSEFFATAGEQ
jgi:hypothetical protein